MIILNMSHTCEQRISMLSIKYSLRRQSFPVALPCLRVFTAIRSLGMVIGSFNPSYTPDGVSLKLLLSQKDSASWLTWFEFSFPSCKKYSENSSTFTSVLTRDLSFLKYFQNCLGFENLRRSISSILFFSYLYIYIYIVEKEQLIWYICIRTTINSFRSIQGHKETPDWRLNNSINPPCSWNLSIILYKVHECIRLCCSICSNHILLHCVILEFLITVLEIRKLHSMLQMHKVHFVSLTHSM